MHKFIISGGPGSGKSTLLKALRAEGFNCVEEASRQLILQQVVAGSRCLPWIDLACFAKLALTRMMADYEQASAQAQGTTSFFDRGIPDIIAYLQVGGLRVDDSYYQAINICTYQPLVFMAPPWEAIYVNDEERWQTFDEATTLYQALVNTYQSLHFTLVDLPYGTVAERVAFVKASIRDYSSKQTRLPFSVTT